MKKFYTALLILFVFFTLTLCSGKKEKKNSFILSEYEKIEKSFIEKAKNAKTKTEVDAIIKEKESQLRKLLKTMEKKKLNDFDKVVRGDIYFELRKNEKAKTLYEDVYKNSKDKEAKKRALNGLIKTAFIDKDTEKIKMYLKEAEKFKEKRIFAENFLLGGVFFRNPEYLKIGLSYKLKYPFYVYVPAAIEILKSTGIIKGKEDEIVKKVKEIYKDNPELISAIDKKLGIQPIEGKEAFDIKNLSPINGKASLTLSSLKGKVILIEFFTISCPHCRESLPHTTELYKKFKKTGKFEALGITALFGTYYDGEKRENNVTPEKEIELMNEYFKSHGVDFPIYHTKDENVFKNYGIEGVPTFVIISKDWKIYKVIEGGGEENINIVKKTIEELLKK